MTDKRQLPEKLTISQEVSGCFVARYRGTLLVQAASEEMCLNYLSENATKLEKNLNIKFRSIDEVLAEEEVVSEVIQDEPTYIGKPGGFMVRLLGWLSK